MAILGVAVLEGVALFRKCVTVVPDFDVSFVRASLSVTVS